MAWSEKIKKILFI